jgi:hypothetical protein
MRGEHALDNIIPYKCRKCYGSGWAWGRELDNPSENTYNDDMTRYTCDWCDGHGVTFNIMRIFTVMVKR